MSKSNCVKESQLPKCRVLQLKMHDGMLMIVKNHSSIYTAALEMGVKPETIYSYCRRIGETLKGYFFMAC